jgi:hypothetical protein
VGPNQKKKLIKNNIMNKRSPNPIKSIGGILTTGKRRDESVNEPEESMMSPHSNLSKGNKPTN